MSTLKTMSLLGAVFVLACGSKGTPAGGSGGTSGAGGSGGSGGAPGSGGSGGAAGSGGTRPDASARDGGADAGATPDGRPASADAATDAAAQIDATAPSSDGPLLAAPPATWKEHWFEHVQDLALGPYNDDVALYFDPDVNRAETDWILPAMTSLWQYVKKTYGPIGPDRLYSIHHQGRYSGGHPSTYFDDSHDDRNVSDCGPGPWSEGQGTIDIPAHESGHVVESANNGVHGSPAFPLWGDSKWMEFYQYDAYLAIGRAVDAQRVFNRYSATTDDFPRAGTHWFRDWFYPLWRDHGHAQVMARFFGLLAQNFPKTREKTWMRYSRDLNWGEFIHFMSGAAGQDLKAQATIAFGWPDEWEAQWTKARTDFPGIQY